MDPRTWGPGGVLCALLVGLSTSCSEAPVCSENAALGRAPAVTSQPAPAGAVRLVVVGDAGEGNTAQLLLATREEGAL